MKLSGEITDYQIYPRYSEVDMMGVDAHIQKDDHYFFIQIKSSNHGIYTGIKKSLKYNRVKCLFLNGQKPSYINHMEIMSYLKAGDYYEFEDFCKIIRSTPE